MTAGFFVARSIIAPPKEREYPLRILSSSKDTITVPVSAGTTVPGQWGLFYDGHGHVTISGAPEIDEKGATWQVVRGTPPPAGTRVAWSGIVLPTPGSAGFLARDYRVKTPAGSAPAWFIGANPGTEHPVWAVHIYGHGSTRAGVIRGVGVTARAGLPAVLPTYRNSHEGPHYKCGRSQLGAREVDDIAALLEELNVTGRERFVLFGWSMGAQIALSLAADSRWGSRIDRLVLESPVLDWRRTLAFNVERYRLPGVVNLEARLWLEHPVLARLMGLERPLDFDAMDWISRAADITQPVLILHGAGDNSTPFSASMEFSRHAADAKVVETGGRHKTGWNVDPGLWCRSASDFLVDGGFSAYA